MGVEEALAADEDAVDAIGGPKQQSLQALLRLSAVSPQDQAELARVLSEAPWRLENFGGEILKAINNHHE